jgi:hypothetical protein
MFLVGDADTGALQLQRAADPHLRAMLAERGYHLVRKRYTRERSVEAWDRCCRNILQSPRCENDGKPRPAAASGRLDEWFGVGLGESIRRALARSYRHTGPGGEWPHSHGRTAVDAGSFWEFVTRCDCGSREASGSADAGLKGFRQTMRASRPYRS